jgi:Zn-dependent peptidase ImmA (M78 family)/DNA-binding XRE family transcriptional regulator
MDFEFKVRPEVLGARLKAARASGRVTQEVAANALGVARTTIVAIEAGKRQITIDELRSLANLYGVSEAELLDDGMSPVDLQVDFRSSAPKNGVDDEAAVASMLNHLANSVLQLENLVGFACPQLDIPRVTLSREDSIEQQAEDVALAVRARLGLGVGPIQDLNTVLESEIGLRIFERPLPSRISGAMAFLDSVGGFVLLNIKHPNSRRRVTAAHELAHALLRKHGLTVHFVDESFEVREERFCDLFACCFLMPASGVRKKATELKKLVGRFTVRELLTMAVYFNVSMEALVRRMVALGLLPNGTYERLRSDGIGTKHRDAVRDELGLSAEPPKFTPRTMLLALAAHKRELLTEQQIASMLELDLLTVREVLDDDAIYGQGELLDLVP